MLKSGLETKFALKIKGLIIVLSFNHQPVQSEQTGWEDVQVSLTGLLSEESALEAAVFPHLNFSRGNRKSRISTRDLASVVWITEQAAGWAGGKEEPKIKEKGKLVRGERKLVNAVNDW